MGRPSKQAQKFWSHVEKGRKQDCWKWHGGVSRRLTPAEREALLSKHEQGGYTVAQLAQEFDITPRAVAYHIHKSRQLLLD